MDDSSTPGLLELYDEARCGYVVAQPDGTLTRVNRTFLELTGYTREALEGARRFQDLLAPASRAFYENQYAPLLRLQGFVKEVAFELETKSGTRVPPHAARCWPRRQQRLNNRHHERLQNWAALAMARFALTMSNAACLRMR